MSLYKANQTTPATPFSSQADLDYSDSNYPNEYISQQQSPHYRQTQIQIAVELLEQFNCMGYQQGRISTIIEATIEEEEGQSLQIEIEADYITTKQASQSCELMEVSGKQIEQIRTIPCQNQRRTLVEDSDFKRKSSGVKNIISWQFSDRPSNSSQVKTDAISHENSEFTIAVYQSESGMQICQTFKRDQTIEDMVEGDCDDELNDEIPDEQIGFIETRQ
ncbi:hypothetical protein FGO68_gene6736 [Halteria grandinella]|uniref:Uncharacterized protein n=1 Tax=Halteria grandinella TaxID=5974 RepID=A0A8J8NKY0_HALGN|nr:hypothetical protein FGO68_gene6736 [Halteria grandinella]